MSTFGDNLKALRKQRHITQQRLADGINEWQGSITAWERGKSTPDITVMQKVADYFHVPLSLLLTPKDANNDESLYEMVDRLHHDPNQRTLFDLTKNFDADNIQAVIAVAKAIAKRRDD